eukprot:578673-Hanusia_phi.AAC.1
MEGEEHDTRCRLCPSSALKIARALRCRMTILQTPCKLKASTTDTVGRTSTHSLWEIELDILGFSSSTLTAVIEGCGDVVQESLIPVVRIAPLRVPSSSTSSVPPIFIAAPHSFLFFLSLLPFLPVSHVGPVARLKLVGGGER